MSYLFLGFVGVLAGIRALALRRRQLSTAAVTSSSVILRPGVLAVLAGIVIAGGAFLLAGGIVALVQG
ncbi:hypothetical protein, partial [Streptomyces sp. NPDC058272]|uniref:hypothetical protein n=1 Tax=Streptomyces sp. NPDC058272 TaxID=3346415 RepID=UPI0036EAD9B5